MLINQNLIQSFKKRMQGKRYQAYIDALFVANETVFLAEEEEIVKDKKHAQRIVREWIYSRPESEYQKYTEEMISRLSLSLATYLYRNVQKFTSPNDIKPQRIRDMIVNNIGRKADLLFNDEFIIESEADLRKAAMGYLFSAGEQYGIRDQYQVTQYAQKLAEKLSFAIGHASELEVNTMFPEALRQIMEPGSTRSTTKKSKTQAAESKKTPRKKGALTWREEEVLDYVKDNEYEPGSVWVSAIQDHLQWTNPKTLSGVISSLVKKDLVTTDGDVVHLVGKEFP